MEMVFFRGRGGKAGKNFEDDDDDENDFPFARFEDEDDYDSPFALVGLRLVKRVCLGLAIKRT